MPCVYILTNQSMPGMVKIGQSSRSAAERCREVGGSTGVPTPFKVAHEFSTVSAEAAVRLEKLVFRHLRKKRVDPRREFFEVSADRAKEVIQEIGEDKHLLFVAPQYYRTDSGVVRQIQEIIYDDEPEVLQVQNDFMETGLDNEPGIIRGSAYLADIPGDIWVGKWFKDDGSSVQQVIRGQGNMRAWLQSFGTVENGKVVARSNVPSISFRGVGKCNHKSAIDHRPKNKGTTWSFINENLHVFVVLGMVAFLLYQLFSAVPFIVAFIWLIVLYLRKRQSATS
jgi:hypothetical protein